MLGLRKLVIATRNPGKAREVAEILEGMPYEIVSLADYPDAPDVEETGSTFAENAAIKARAYADFTGELTLADDSGLEVDALDGAPGVFSSRFAPTDAERISKLLDLMRNVPDDKRAARFRCAVAIAEPSAALVGPGHHVPDHHLKPVGPGYAENVGPGYAQDVGPGYVIPAPLITREGKIEGTIAHFPKGSNGFGYDPVFYVPELGKHFAELTADEKNAISHRGKALREARKALG